MENLFADHSLYTHVFGQRFDYASGFLVTRPHPERKPGMPRLG
jgi:hypothetical protein